MSPSAVRAIHFLYKIKLCCNFVGIKFSEDYNLWNIYIKHYETTRFYIYPAVACTTIVPHKNRDSTTRLSSVRPAYGTIANGA